MTTRQRAREMETDMMSGKWVCEVETWDWLGDNSRGAR